MNKHNHRFIGFTLVEVVVVIVVIGVLASLVITASSVYVKNAALSKTRHDLGTLKDAIRQARISKGGVVLREITGSTWTTANCTFPYSPDGSTPYYTGNTAYVEPKALPKTSDCWLDYYSALDKIAAASGTNLDSLKKGDYYGNPYMIDENEGEFPDSPCFEDTVSAYKPGTYKYYFSPANKPFLVEDVDGVAIQLPLAKFRAECN